MATQAQINANRQNAQNSTGPRSPNGKAATSRNALKHGLCAEKHLLMDEDEQEFLALVQDLVNTLHPTGEAEEKLVKRIAVLQWRLDRALPLETQIYHERLAILAVQNEEITQEEREAETELLAPAFMEDGQHDLIRLARYETSLERSIDRCLRQLERFRQARAASEITEQTQNEPKPDPPAPRPLSPPERSEHRSPVPDPSTQHPAPSTRRRRRRRPLPPGR